MRSVTELEERLSAPRPELVADLRELDGDILVLGAGGKLGPSLVRLALRGIAEADTDAKVIAVSRFSEPGLADTLAAHGAQTVIADITDDDALAALPDAENVVLLVGAKFGTAGKEHGTWATNTYLPGRVANRFRAARIVALSTGNVYPLTPITSGGSTENTPPGPVGEYAMSCLGRERILAHFSAAHGTPMSFVRLNYATEMRYGVLVDLARAILAGEPVDLTMGHVNVIWQGYANEVALRSLRHASSPPFLLNVTGPEIASVRQLARALAAELGKPLTFTGEEAATALLSNAQRCHGLFGYPDVPLATLTQLTARWVADGLPLLGKPTKFQSRYGRF